MSRGMSRAGHCGPAVAAGAGARGGVVVARGLGSGDDATGLTLRQKCSANPGQWSQV